MSRRRNSSEAPISLFSFQDLITSLSGILILLVLIMAIQVALDSGEGTERPTESVTGPDIETMRAEATALRARLRIVQDAQGAAAPPDAVETAKRIIQAEREQTRIEREAAKAKSEIAELRKLVENLRDGLVASSNKVDSLAAELSELLQAQLAARDRLFYIPEAGTARVPILVECSGAGLRFGYIDRDSPPVVIPASRLDDFKTHLAQLSRVREYLVFMVKPSGIDTFQVARETAREMSFETGSDALAENKHLALGVELR